MRWQLVAAITFVLHRSAVAADSGLSHGQLVGVVVGSVGGGLLLVVAAFLCCCFYYYYSRRCQTGDLTWAKTGDLEAAAGPYLAQEGQPSSPHFEGRDGSEGPGGGVKPVLPVAVAAGEGPPALDAVAALQESSTPSVAGKQPSRSPRSGVAHFFLNRKAQSIPRLSVGKDKNLEVSRSARVEPSAEVEMSTPFEPAATNHGPPLSKSSMLLRWLHSAEDDNVDAVAAQLVAAAAAVAGGAGGPAGGARVPGRRGASAPPAGLNVFSDRLPLLSLAAQSGIVFSKMPPSVASSPAVSVTEGSMSRHMLKGTLRRSDTPYEDTAYSPTAADGTGSGGSAPGCGDNRYPASLSAAPVGSIGGRPSQRAGIVFDHVPFSSAPASRLSTLGGEGRHPTFGGAP
ncbi:hypothetical protein GPECTOR_20g427 [Gonium pectorale]|uniref:Uncharacterized protein n=1 Tax=Gonium pectorale TaxID=33097 RepID=A0A150GID1_GONPE|nr:hypothetical protein GPECTOR_20g427 [Gonium pectorale]|eukprot:KXZ49572.1 hypothetical protein GPECTOR_20g427 [Gonium pectorale]